MNKENELVLEAYGKMYKKQIKETDESGWGDAVLDAFKQRNIDANTFIDECLKSTSILTDIIDELTEKEALEPSLDGPVKEYQEMLKSFKYFINY
jgi:hypothetical protein